MYVANSCDKPVETARQMNRAERRRRQKLEQKGSFAKNKDAGRRDKLHKLMTHAIALHKEGRFAEAVRSYRKALKLEPEEFLAHSNMGAALQALGRVEAAIASCEKAIALKPDHAPAYFNLGNALQEQGRLDAAVASYQQALTLNPRLVAVYNNLGVLMNQKGGRDEAVALFEKAISINPDDAGAYYHLGNIDKERGRLDQALAHYRKAVALRGDHGDAYNNMGVVLNELDRPDEAIACYMRAVEIAPEYVDAYINLGNLLFNQTRFAQALEVLQVAIRLQPDNLKVQKNMGFACLALGRFEEGWKYYESRLLIEREWHAAFSFPRWQGEPLVGKTVLVYAEQGLGDELQFSLLYPDMARLAQRCVVLCGPRLQTLFTRSFPQIEFIAVEKRRYEEVLPRLPKIDYQVAAGSLRGHLRPDMHGIKPQLVPEPQRVQGWRRRFADMGPEMKIGISWTTGYKTRNRIRSHSALDQWGPLLSVPGISLVNLYYGECEEEIASARAAFDCDIIAFAPDEIDLVNDLDELAAMMSALDLVVTTASAVASLAAVTGCKALFLYGQKIKWFEMGQNGIYGYAGGKSFYYADAAGFAAAMDDVKNEVMSCVKGDSGV